MRRKYGTRLAAINVVLCLGLILQPLLNSVYAGSKGGFRSSSSFSRSSSPHYGSGHSWSPRTHDTWKRSGGGFFGSSDKGSGYKKPIQTPPPAAGKGPSSGTPNATGFTKPSSGSTQSGGYSKPFPGGVNQRQDSPSSSPRSSGGYSKPNFTPPGSQPFQGGTRFDKETIKQEQKKASQQSLEKYKVEKSTFSKPPYKGDGTFSGPLADRARSQTGFDQGNVWQKRDSYYRGQGYQPPPYVFNTSPSFGIFDTLFLFWMLDHITNKNVAKAAYSYSDDPAFQKWRQEVENLSKDNSELRSKLAEMDRQIKQMEGTPKDPAYLPPGVPPEVALTPTAFGKREGDKPVLRFAGGQKGGWYDKYLTLFEKNCPSLAIKRRPSSGSLENLQLLEKGEADAALVQSDVLAMREIENKQKNLVTEQTTLFLEYIQLVAHRDGGVKSLSDLDPGINVIYVGPKNSGTEQTWQFLRKLDPRLARIKTRNADYYEALEKVQKEPNSLMLFVGGLRSDFLKKAEDAASRKDRLHLIPIDDKRFTEIRDRHGNNVYQLTTIPARTYPNLQRGWFFGHDVKTLTVEAVLVLRNDWAAIFGTDAMDALSASILETRPKIEKMVNG